MHHPAVAVEESFRGLVARAAAVLGFAVARVVPLGQTVEMGRTTLAAVVAAGALQVGTK